MTRAFSTTRRTCAFLAALLLLLAARGTGRAAEPAGGDVGELFARGEILQDRNGDGLVDFVNCRIVVAADAPAADIVAAANLAARLGFETSALTLPIGTTDTELTPGASTPTLLLVGRSNKLVTKLAGERKVDLTGLKAGQGVVAVVPAAFGNTAAIVVAGGDDRGTEVAASAAAARLPYLWQLRTTTIARVQADVREFLADRGVAGATVAARRVVYSDGHDFADSLGLHVSVGDGQVSAATSALKELADAHVVGKAVFTDRLADRLNYYELGAIDLGVSGRGAGQEQTVSIPRFGPPYRNGFPGNPWRPAPRALSLSTLYTSDGILPDGRGQDFIPDQTATTLIVDDDERGLVGAIDLAARIGMESTGVALPLARLASNVKDPATEPNPILIGRTGSLVQSLNVGPLAAGQGLVRIVPEGFGTFPAIVVTGADAAGVRAAASHLAGKVPFLAKAKRGEESYAAIENDVARFYQLKSSAGQAAAALTALDETTEAVDSAAVTAIDAKVFTEDDRPDLAKAVEAHLKKTFAAARVSASAPSRYGPVPVFEETLELPWEVDDFWKKFNESVLPKVTPGASVDVEALLSESPETRREIETKVRQALTKAGAASSNVRVICAYKQGFSWLSDTVLPEIKGKNAKRITVRFPTLEPPATGNWLGMPIRWLQELFPIDEILARELGIGIDDIVFEKVEGGPTTYSVEVTDGSGRKIHSSTFSPRFVAQEYLKAIPTATIHVTTGGIRATIGTEVVVDDRIKTDLERFWDIYQDRIIPDLFAYVRKNTSNRLGPENQPYFRDFVMEFDMSEPDFVLKLDEERISSLDSLHEDLTFNTIDFLSILSGQQPGSRNVAPGRIMPIMHPVRPGRGATVKISLGGNATPRPRLVVTWEDKVRGKTTRSIDLKPVGVKAPRTVAEVVQGDRVVRAEVVVDAETTAAARQAALRAEAFARQQKDGGLRDQLAYAALDQLDLGVRSGAATTLARIPLADRAGAEARTKPKVIKPEAGKAIVTWDHVIGPDELEQEIIPRLRTYPEINPYVAGETYRKRNVWAMDVMLPMEAQLWSQAKASALKPVLFISTRQHANEISATSATLRLMELFATDPKYREYLKKVNIVYHPMENPDGAANHQVYLKYTPTYILHGGYWSSVMRDVGAYIWDDDPLLPEALVRRKLYRQWSPDVYMNTHSYPAHEWVHTFAGYKVPWFLAFWIPRGYHINLHHMKDPNFPDHGAVGDELRERIIDEVQGNAFIRATNARMIHRYEKYARRYEPDPFRLEVYKGMNILHDYTYSYEEGGVFSRDIYVSSIWRRPNGGNGPGGRDFLSRYPQITVLDLGCDMPDETPSPEWLEKMAAPGQFGYLMANVKLINDSQYEIKRFDEDFSDRVSLSVFRPRPVKASRPPAPTTTSSRD